MNRLKKLTYIQYIICGLLVIFILCILLSGHAKNVSFETVQQNIVSCEGINTLQKRKQPVICERILILTKVSLTGLFTIAAMV